VYDVFPASPSSTCSTFAEVAESNFVLIDDQVAVLSDQAAVTRCASIGTLYFQSVWVWS